MSFLGLILTALVGLTPPPPQFDGAKAPPAFEIRAVMIQDSVRGRTIRWTWTEGPTAGVTHEHEFRRDGTLEWRVLTGPRKGHAAEEEEYAVFEISDEVYAVSYLADSGYTLTVVLDFQSGNMYGFASGRSQWYPGRGTFEVIE